VAMRARGKELRAVSEGIMMLILIAVAVVIGAVMFLIVGPMLRGGSEASISVQGSGLGSPNGASGTITLIVKNTGSVPVVINRIDIWAPGAAGGAAVGGATGLATPSLAAGGTAPPAPLASGSTAGYRLAAGQSQTFTFTVTGSNLYPGALIRIQVWFTDPASGSLGSAAVDVSLR